MIPEQLRNDLQQRVEKAVTPREAAVDVLKELQRHCGWLTDEALAEAAQLLGISTLQVEELATFYEMIYRRPVGQTSHPCLRFDFLLVHGGRTSAAASGETAGDRGWRNNG